jgi:integrase
MRARHKQGSVVFDKRRKVWNYLYCEGGTRRTKTIGSKRDYPSKAAAWQAVESIKPLLQAPQHPSRGITVSTLVEAYKSERMPKRASTRRGYECWLSNHILPRWGDSLITDLQPRPVELWLQSLELSPKSKLHIRGLVSVLWDYAQWRGDTPITRNPMTLVNVKSASQRVRKPRSLTVEEFQALLETLGADPCWRTMLLVAVSFGLRISELLGLKWSDVDWLNKTIRIERGVVKQIVDQVKTSCSARTMVCASELLEVLKGWKQLSQFSAPDDWMFPSIVKLGRQPLSYTYVWESLTDAAKKAGIAHISSHTFRHTHRSWLDSVGTPVGVQQKLMRHADIRTTMNIYGDAATADMREAHGKVVRMAMPIQA